MSAPITESDTYTTTIITPQTGETDYPSTITTGLTGLANRLNFWNRRLKLEGATDTRTEANDTDEYSSVIVPDDALIGSTNVFKELATKLGNRTKYLRERVAGAGSGYSVGVPLCAPVQNTSNRFSSNGQAWLQTDVTSAGTLRFHMPLPDFGKMTALTLTVDGGSAHGALPATMPRIALIKIAHIVGNASISETTIATLTDASANVAAYELIHTISITGLSETLSVNADWLIVIEGETGANSLANQFRFFRIVATVAAP